MNDELTNDGLTSEVKEQKEKNHLSIFEYLVLFGIIFSIVLSCTFYVICMHMNKKTQIEEPLKIESTLDNTNLTANLVDVSDIVEKCMPSIVAITNSISINYQNFFGQNTTYDTESSGSGIIFSKDETYLYIVTNAHVVSNSNKIVIQFYDDELVDGVVQGTDITDDLAVVKVKLEDLKETTLNNIKIATISDCENLKVGNATIAIGNALGYGQTVTTGIISALDRSITTLDENTRQTTIIDNLIQTDAAINPGNSGGALLNANGEVIGINSVKFASTEVEGIGYAISMKIATPIIEKLITDGSFERTQTAYLGVLGKDMDTTFAKMYNMPSGAYVMSVYDNSGAKEAGVCVGDIITKIDNKTITSMTDIQHYLLNKTVGDTVTLTVERQNGSGYEELELYVTLSSEEIIPKSDTETSNEENTIDNSSIFDNEYNFNWFYGLP